MHGAQLSSAVLHESEDEDSEAASDEPADRPTSHAGDDAAENDDHADASTRVVNRVDDALASGLGIELVSTGVVRYVRQTVVDVDSRSTADPGHLAKPIELPDGSEAEQWQTVERLVAVNAASAEYTDQSSEAGFEHGRRATSGHERSEAADVLVPDQQESFQSSLVDDGHRLGLIQPAAVAFVPVSTAATSAAVHSATAELQCSHACSFPARSSAASGQSTASSDAARSAKAEHIDAASHVPSSAELDAQHDSPAHECDYLSAVSLSFSVARSVCTLNSSSLYMCACLCSLSLSVGSLFFRSFLVCFVFYVYL